MDSFSLSSLSAFRLLWCIQTIEKRLDVEENKPEQPLLSMHRAQLSISFQNLQHAANLLYNLLDMSVESKAVIKTNT